MFSLQTSVREHRLRKIVADERDAEYAAAILNDGSVDPVWKEQQALAYIAAGSVGAFGRVPTIITPVDLQHLRQTGAPAALMRALERKIPASMRRYPLTYARVLATDAARVARYAGGSSDVSFSLRAHR
jgi:hypothetical protein